MKRKFDIIPSIASADPLCIGEEIRRVQNYKRLHIDIEDGNFVPNITFGLKMIRAISDITPQLLDVHILANNPEQYIQELEDYHIGNIAIHYETTAYPMKTLFMIRKNGRKAGLALNFTAPAEAVIPFIDNLDYVLVMTAEPDGEGEIFRSVMLDKIRRLREILPEEKEIWADGGIGEKELPQVVDSGVNRVVMGRAVFSQKS